MANFVEGDIVRYQTRAEALRKLARNISKGLYGPYSYPWGQIAEVVDVDPWILGEPPLYTIRFRADKFAWTKEWAAVNGEVLVLVHHYDPTTILGDSYFA